MVHLFKNRSSTSHFLVPSIILLLLSFIICSASLSPSSSSPSSSLTSSSLTSLSLSNGLTLKTTINPNCEKYDSCSKATVKPDLIYTQSTDNDTSIHFIASTLGGFPGLLITRTHSLDALKINWDSLMGDCKGSFNTSSLPDDSIGIILMKFFDLDPKNIQWAIDKVNPLNCDSSKCSFGYSTESGQSPINETISLNIELTNVQSFSKDFPHLQITPSSMYIDLQIKNVDKSQIDKKVGGVNLLIVTSGNSFGETFDKSIDDEHSPGIFTKRSFIFSKSNDSASTSYIQWKPIAYKSQDRVMSKTLEIESSSLINDDLTKLNVPLYCFFQSPITYSSYSLNVTFVQDDDASSNDKIDLISWSLVFGLNSPAPDKLSLFIKLMIFVGVGLSSVVMFISLVYVTIKKFQKSRAQRESGLLNEVFLDY